jgi:hypothetical protein
VVENIIKEVSDTLSAWKNQRTWGTIEIEVHDGVPTLLRKETKQKFTSNGGFKHGPGRIEHRGTSR